MNTLKTIILLLGTFLVIGAIPSCCKKRVGTTIVVEREDKESIAHKIKRYAKAIRNRMNEKTQEITHRITEKATATAHRVGEIRDYLFRNQDYLLKK